MSKYQEHIDKLPDEIVDDSLVIDCHSFPSDLSDVDICIGVNGVWSKPSDDVIDCIKSVFEAYVFKVGVNTPYSNSITPFIGNYKSLMIEVSTRRYLRGDDRLNVDTLYAPLITGLMNTIYRALLA